MDGLEEFARTVTELEQRVGIEDKRRWGAAHRKSLGLTTLIELLEAEADRLENVRVFETAP